MKLTAILIFGLCLHVTAKSNAQKVTLSLKNAPVQQVLEEIGKQTGLTVVYNEEFFKGIAPVTVDVKNVDLDELLRKIFKSLSFDVNISNNTLVFTKKPNPSLTDEPFPFSGVITDADGNPLSKATIVVVHKPGMVAMVTADDKGRFSLSAEPGQTLKISHVGYEDISYTIKKTQQNIQFKMQPVNADLTTVTVSTGYQTISRERSAGSFSKVQGEAMQKKSVSMNVIDRLEGLVPGLAVNYGEGADKFLIRGVNSVDASRMPLYVLDGTPVSYDDLPRVLNPNDVEDVNILKDATAASIWGAQAANGVIVITTKKGKNTGKIKVNYDGFVSFKGLPDYSYQKMMSSEQFIKAARDIFDPNTYPWDAVTNFDNLGRAPIVYPHERILYDEYLGVIDEATANKRLDSLAALNNRSQLEKHFLQPALLTNHNVTFSGGSSFHSYYGSLGYTNEQATNRTNNNRYNINLRQNFVFTPSIKLDLITTLSQENLRKFTMEGLPTLNSYLPYAMFEDGDGNGLSHADLKMYDGLRNNAEQLSRVSLGYNPVEETKYAKNNNSTTTMARVNAGLTINIARGLNFEGRYQYQNGNNSSYTFYDQNSYLVRNELVNFTVADPQPVYYLPFNGGHYQTSNSRSVAWSIRNQLTYDGSWNNDKHRLTLLAGTETRNDKARGFSSYLRGYNQQTLAYEPYDERTLKSNPLMNPVIGNYYGMSILFGNSSASTERETRFVSFYSNLGYTFNRKYNLNASVRMDQSNLFGTDVSQQYKPIWSLGGSWYISNESFFDVRPVNSLKLRLSYGIGGNSPNPGSGGPYDILSPFPHPWFTVAGAGYQVIRPANDKLIWEKTATLNAGIDASLFNNRLSFSLDVYDKQTSDLLTYQSFDVTNGWFNGYTNSGDLYNKGIEISLQSRNIVSKDFSWSTSVNFGSNRNKITKVGNIIPTTPQSLLSTGGRAFIQGYSAYSLFSLKWAGLDNTGAPQVYNSKGEKIKFSGDITMDDVSYAGTTQPLYYGGITNNFQYKRFDLSFLVVYNLGHKMLRDINGFYSGRLQQNIAEYFENRWKQPGDENKTDIPGYIADGAISGSSRSLELYSSANINVVSASYARLRDLTLSYRIPVGFLQELKVYGQVNNILLWAANDHDIDPEYANMGQSGLQSGSGSSIQALQLPSIRPNRMKAFYTIGVNVSFK